MTGSKSTSSPQLQHHSSHRGTASCLSPLKRRHQIRTQSLSTPVPGHSTLSFLPPLPDPVTTVHDAPPPSPASLAELSYTSPVGSAAFGELKAKNKRQCDSDVTNLSQVSVSRAQDGRRHTPELPDSDPPCHQGEGWHRQYERSTWHQESPSGSAPSDLKGGLATLPARATQHGSPWTLKEEAQDAEPWPVPSLASLWPHH